MAKGFWKRGLCMLLATIPLLGSFIGCAPKEDEIVIDVDSREGLVARSVSRLP